MENSDWHGCYESGWQGLISDESFAHPAKFARGLIRRIYEHLRDHYGLPAGSVVVDPFGGVALGALDAMECGYAWVGVELEARFVELGEQNLAKWRPFYPDAQAVLVQGDSRELRRHVGEAGVIVSSPPWNHSHVNDDQTDSTIGVKGRMAMRNNYGDSPGQLGSMRPGSLDAVVSSPPYAESIGNENQIDYSKAKGKHDGLKPSTARDALGGPYGTTDGNLGNLKAGSVEAVIRNVLTNDTASTIIRGKETSNDAETKTSGETVRKGNEPIRSRSRDRRERKGDLQPSEKSQLSEAEISVPAEVEQPQDRDRVPVPPAGHEPTADCRILRRDGWDDSEGNEETGNQGAPKRQKAGQEPLQLHERPPQSGLPQANNQGQVPPVRGDGESGDSPQERRPLRQPTGEPGGSLQLLPHAGDKTEVVEGQESGTADAQKQRSDGVEEKEVACIVGSPPFADSDNRKPGPCLKQACEKYGVGTSHAKQDWQPSQDNLASLPAGSVEAACDAVDAVISSPPYEAAQSSDANSKRQCESGYFAKSTNRKLTGSYGKVTMDAAGQLGNATGGTFWEAALQIVRECHAILKPGGICAWVVKAFVRAGKIVDFPGDWRRLCESVGFELVEEVHASLVKTDSHPGLFGEPILKEKKRCSFFRRNHEIRAASLKWLGEQPAEIQKALVDAATLEHFKAKPRRIREIAAKAGWEAAGKPFVEIETRIDFEVVLFMRKADGTIA